MKTESEGKKHASLFSGIGGFDLAAEWMGWQNIFQVEIDPFCTKVLEKNFPNTKRYGDIKQFDGSDYAGRIDILTGGFPCQPFSAAGKQRGTDDDRHLWPEMLRIIRIVKPTWVVAENVRGLLTIQDGVVFEQVCLDLENEGYEVQPTIIPACAVNAPHRRDRIWFIAHATSERCDNAQHSKRVNAQRNWEQQDSQTSNGLRYRENAEWRKNWLEVATELCRVDDGLPRKLHRANRLKALGNAIVPQVAYQIFKSLT
jgi:DNA (cytosine-5)-methyltransferase 1